MQSKIKKVKKIHKIWEEMQNLPENVRKTMPIATNLMGKYQYIYTSDKGEISLIQLNNYFPGVKILWEIYCVKGDLIESVERFATQKEAEKRINELLD